MQARARQAMPDAALAFLDARGLAVPDIAIVQPADPFLDTAGEALRRRIYLTEGEHGESLCLRPEFTIPVCLRHIATAAGTPARYGYCGPVFRQRRAGSTEFPQAGIEDLGDHDRGRADARSLADAVAMLDSLKPGLKPRIVLGDEALFAALLAALDLPEAWRARLTRFFGDDAKLDAALASLANGQARDLPFAGMDRDTMIARLETEMDEAGLLDSGSRTPAEIADRILEKRALAGGNLSSAARKALSDFLQLESPLAEAEDRLAALAAANRIGFGPALAAFAARNRALVQAGLDLGCITFRAAFGRPLDYYTAMQFELYGTAKEPLAGGGRYDRLLTMLGAGAPIPGVGFSVWLDRVEAEP